jgi:hypothetical protein
MGLNAKARNTEAGLNTGLKRRCKKQTTTI